MGVYTDLLASPKTFGDRSSLWSFLTNRLNEIDPTIAAGAVATNAVHSIAQDESDHSGGTFTLTVTLRNGETFTTGTIAFNANAATIEGEIDTAATSAGITGWTDGDISVSGGVLQAAGAPVVLTFDGDSVSGQNHPITTFDGSSLTGGAEPATRVSITTAGQTARLAWGVLLDLGIVSGSLPTQTAPASTDGVTIGVNARNYPAELIRELAKEAAFEDANNATYHTLMNVLGYQDLAPAVSHTGNNTEV